MYQFKVIRIADVSEWQPAPSDPMGGAGQDIEGAWLARRVTVEVSNGLVVLETRDFLIPEPYDTDKFRVAIDTYRATLPERHPDEGLVL